MAAENKMPVPPAPRRLAAESLRQLRRCTGFRASPLVVAGFLVAAFGLVVAIALGDKFPGMFLVSSGASSCLWEALVARHRFQQKRRVCERGAVAAGTVAGVRRWQRGGPKVTLRSADTVRYCFTDGLGREQHGAERGRDPAVSSKLKEGDTITVLYDAANPRNSLVLEMLGIEFDEGRRNVHE